MNAGPAEATALIEGIQEKLGDSTPRSQVLVCPPMLSVAAVNTAIAGDARISSGSQNVYFEDKGAYTGEVSVGMIKEAGCGYVIIGHSERRQYFGETDESVNKKSIKTIAGGLIPVICVGEVLAERKEERHFDVVLGQVRGALADISADDLKSVVIAYEPVWAIGTGEVATPEQAQEMHAAIRGEVAKLYDQAAADALQILYGGSLKPGNANDILKQTDVDGGLIGGASLKADSFTEIITIAESLY